MNAADTVGVSPAPLSPDPVSRSTSDAGATVKKPRPTPQDNSQQSNTPPRLSRDNARKLTEWFALTDSLQHLIGLLPPEEETDSFNRRIVKKQAIQNVGKLAAKELASGKEERFFRAIERFGPELLAVPEVMAIMTQWWVQKGRSDGSKARKNLLRIGEALAFVGRGNLPHLTDEEKPKSKRRSASLSRSSKKWIARYQKYVPCYGEQDALRQLEADFKTQAHFDDPSQKSLAWKKIHKRIRESSTSKAVG